MFSLIGENICRILVDRFCKVTDGLTYDKQEDIRAGRECVDQIFTLKQIGEKTWKKKN